jgi:hypothetical protein
MIKAKGLSYTIEVDEKEIRLHPNTFLDMKELIDPVVPFDVLLGFHYKPATWTNNGGYLHLKTWNSDGYMNHDFVSGRIFDMFKNHNSIKFSFVRRKEFAAVVVRLREIIDANADLIAERMKIEEKLMEERRQAWAEYRATHPVQPKPVTYYGFWIDWN